MHGIQLDLQKIMSQIAFFLSSIYTNILIMHQHISFSPKTFTIKTNVTERVHVLAKIRHKKKKNNGSQIDHNIAEKYLQFTEIT